MIRALLLVLLVSGCAATRQAAPRMPGQQRWAAVLVAGDGSIPVFDNATGRMAALLEAAGTPAADIRRFSDAPDMLSRPHVQLASKARVLAGIAGLRPQPGQSCLVFMTSHGAQNAGFLLAAHDEVLTPGELDAALEAGCGTAPTVAVVSACYSGGFAQPPMARPNRVVLTAAAADRASFGCDAGAEYAFYDDCLLQTLQARPGGWPEVIADTARCVARLEAEHKQPASSPQSVVGPAATGLAVPG